MNYKLLPKERPPRSVDVSRPPTLFRRQFVVSVLLMLFALVSQKSHAAFDFETTYSAMDWHPSLEKPHMEIGLCFYDCNGSDSFFLHTATEGSAAGPALYVDGNYICSPDFELAWPGSNNTGNDSGLNDEKGNDGWWGNTYTKTINGVKYTIKWWNPRKINDRFYVTVHVFLDKFRVDHRYTVTIKGWWKTNNEGTRFVSRDFKFNALANPFKESTLKAEYIDYTNARLTGSLNTSIKNYVAVSRDHPGEYINGEYQYADPTKFSGYKEFAQGTSSVGNMDFYVNSSYSAYGPRKIYVQHSVYVPAGTYPAATVWSCKELELQDFLRAENFTSNTDKWKKQITLNWGLSELSNAFSTGSFSLYRYPKDDPDAKVLIADKILTSTRKYIDDVPEYDRDYRYEIEFRPKDIPDGVRINRLVQGLDCKIEREFIIKVDSIVAGESSVKLAWQSEPYKGSLPFSFNIMRHSTEAGEWEQVGTKMLNNNNDVQFSYTDNQNLSVCTGYKYMIQGTLFEGFLASSDTTKVVRLDGQSKVLSVTTSKGDYQGMVKVSWEAKQVDSNPTKYELLRRVKGTENWASLYKVSGTNTYYSYEDNTAQPGLYYDYKVISTTSCGTAETQLYETDEGFCRSTGIVSGRITYGTGTAVKDARVSLVKNSETASDASQFYAVSTQVAGDGLFLDLDGKTLNEKFNGKDFSVQMFVRPNDVQNGASPVFFDLDGQLSLSLGEHTDDGYKLMLSQGERTDTTGIFLPTRDYTSLTLSVSKNNKAIVTAINKLDTVSLSQEMHITPINFEDSVKSGICMGGSYTLNADNAFSGYIDEMRLFSGKALTTEEILKNYNHMLAGTEDGLFAYWPVDEGISGQTYAYDYSKTSGVANGNHARFGGVKTSVTSEIVPESTQLSLFAYTDAQGNFVIRGVPFSGDGTNYMVVPTLGIHEFSPQYSTRYVSASSLVHSGVDFTDVSSFPVSGYVLYEGTDYPVEGCNFYVDGDICSKDGQLITSASDGTFTISVPIGDHFIEVKKDGHVFASNGRYPADPNETGERLTFEKSVKNLEFVDKTLVNFSGRVVGGSTEGNKPLGFGESVNNIGITELVLTPNNSKYRLNVIKVQNGTTFSYEDNPEKANIASATTAINSRSWRGAADFNKQIIIQTDSLTGEFSAMIPPLNYKVESMTVKANGKTVGNPTTADLTNCRMEYTDSIEHEDGWVEKYAYNYALKQTYHSEPSFVVTQADRNDGAFGIDQYSISDAEGDINITDIYAVAEDGTVTYKYGGAVYESLNNYIFNIEAFEEYINEDVKGSPAKYVVPLENVEVTIANELSAEQLVYAIDNTAGRPAGTLVEVTDNKITLDSDGKATYVWKAGLPNITAPYTRTISMYYDIDERTYNWSGNGMPCIVLGSMPTGNNFVTAGPDMVEMILRDPPGSLSSAEWTSGTISSRSTLHGNITDSETDIIAHLKFGPKITTSAGFGVAVETESKVVAEVDLGTKITKNIESANTWSHTITTTKSIATSADPEYVGANGDVFVGTSNNIVFGKAREVNFHRVSAASDEVKLDLEDIMTTGLEYQTAFAYTAYYIENTLIPNLRALRDTHLQTVTSIEGHENTGKNPIYLTTLSPDDERYGSNNHDKKVWGSQATKIPSYVGPSYTMIIPKDETKCYEDSVLWCNTQIENWTNYLRLNEQEKVTAHKNKDKYLVENASFDSGTTITHTYEQEESNGTTYDCTLVACAHISAQTGYQFNNVGVVGHAETVSGGGSHNANESEETKLASISYTLQEEGDDDALSVDVYNYGAYSPIFRTVAGQTSGPYEGEVRTKYLDREEVIMEATMQIEVPDIDVVEPLAINVPTGQPANFRLKLSNKSEIDEDVYYKLLVIDETNPNGAKISIDGQVLTENRLIKIPGGQTVEKALQLTQTNLGILDYDSIGVVLASQSQYDPTSIWDQIADTVYISARFVPSSSTVAMKLDHTTINTMLGDDAVLNISFSQFDRNYNNLKAFRLQYLKQGDLSWTTLHEYVLNEADKTENNEYLPESATVSYKFTMKDFADGVYTFRVLSVATYGNEEVYNQSEEITVTKDMERPQPLGLPQPTDGILNAGDEISIQYNEDIQKGMLTNMANFRVTGILNGAAVQHDVALDMATTESSATTEADIMLNNHDFSIDAWINVSGEGNIISHGNGTSKLEIGTDAQGHLTVRIGSTTYTSTNVMPKNKWIYLTTSYKAGTQPILNAACAFDSSNVTLFDDTPVIAYEGLGKLQIGSSSAQGAIHELTLWDEAHDATVALLNKDKTKKPSTPHLIGYWKMNEGEGTLITDYARNRHMKMTAETWKIDNDNKAINLDGTSHLDIKTAAISPLASDNCAIELWMRAAEQTGEAELFQSGEVELWIDGNGMLQLSSLGNDYAASQASLLDNAWHHVALNVLRTGHVSVYVDGKRTLSTSAYNIGQTASDRLIIGARRSQGSETMYAYDRMLKGSVDEVRIWNATLTADLLKQRRKTRLSGDEGGLVAYYPFETKVLNSENQIVTEGSAKDLMNDDNIAIYESGSGFAYTDEAPAIRAAQTETNVNFSFTASDNKVVLDIKENAADIEGCTLHFTAQSILDLNGNRSLPVSWTAFVNCNELTWDTPSISVKKRVGESDSFDASFTNNGGTQQIWTLSGLPTWLTASMEDGAAEPLTTTTIRFDIAQGVAIGTYEETVYLTGNDDIASPLTIRLNVTGDVPEWTVNSADFENSMNLIGTLSFLGQPTNDPEDLVAVFIDGECRGVTHPVYNARYDNYFVLLDIYGNSSDANKPVTFYAFDNSTGTKYPDLSTSQVITFRDNQLYGTFAAPVVLNATDLVEQSRNLVQGWNWLSFYVHPDDMAVEKIFSPIAGFTDVVKSQSHFGTFENGTFFGNSFDTDNSSMYKVRMTAPQTLNVIGKRLTQEQRTITLQPGWNWAAYNSMQTASVADALAGMDPQSGDIIKAQQGFAMYDGYEWNGSLKSLSPGQGYMIQSSTSENRTFEYPAQSAAPASSISSMAYMASATEEWSGVFDPIDYHKYPGNMCIVAYITFDGASTIGTEVGVFDDSECRTVEITNYESYAYLTVPGEEKTPLFFKLAKDGEIFVAEASVTYEEDALIGSHSTPFVIAFSSQSRIDGIYADAENFENQWFTVGGVCLPSKPTEIGVYILRTFDKKNQTVSTRKVVITK